MRISDWSSDVCSSDLWLSTERHSVRDGASQYHGASHRFFRRSLFFAAYSSLSINPASCNFLSFCRRAIRSSLPGSICCSSAITLGEPLCSWAAASSACCITAPILPGRVWRTVLARFCKSLTLSIETEWLVMRVALADLAVAVRGKKSEEHTSELQSLMRISYAVFCL